VGRALTVHSSATHAKQAIQARRTRRSVEVSSVLSVVLRGWQNNNNNNNNNSSSETVTLCNVFITGKRISSISAR